MPDDKKGVLEFIDETKTLPPKMTVESAKGSQYLFHLLIRFYQKRLTTAPTFCPYSEKNEAGIRSVIEEHSLMEGTRIYVLSECDVSFIKRMKPPAGTYVLAEATGGELKAEKYRYFERRDILRTLLYMLNLKMSLRALLEGDWSKMTDYGDYESVLRKAKAAEWTEEQVVESLKTGQRIPILLGIKTGKFEDIFRLAEQRGESYVYNVIQDTLTQILRYQSLRQMGHDDERILRELDLGRWRLKELLEEAAAFTIEELECLAKELVDKDRLYMRNKTLGINLICLSSATRLTR